MSVISEKWNYFLSNFRNFAICDGEITPSRQKNKRVSLFCSRLFVTFALLKTLVTQKSSN
jgi:hypothetical protein